MSDKKRSNIEKMQDYKNEKMEIANEIGTIDPNDVEVNVKIASQNEPVNSNKTITKQHNLNNPNKTAGRKNI